MRLLTLSAYVEGGLMTVLSMVLFSSQKFLRFPVTLNFAAHA